MLKHFTWKTVEKSGDQIYEEKGRIAVLYNKFDIKIKQISGRAMPAKFLSELLGKLFSEGEFDKMWSEYLHSQYPTRFCSYVGMSGCKEVWVEEVTDEEFMEVRRSRRIHISMNKKLNEIVEIRLEDFCALIWNFIHDFSFDGDEFEEFFPIEEVSVPEKGKFEYNLFREKLGV